MKKVLFVLSVLALVGCSANQVELGVVDEGALLGTIDSKANIGDPSAELYDETWLSAENRKSFLEDFFAKVKSGHYEVFDFFPGELTPMAPEALAYLFHHVDTEYVEEQVGVLKPIYIEETFDPSGIVFFKFRETLKYNKETGSFYKKVTHVCPMEKVYNEDGSERGYRGLFWVKIVE